MLDVTKGVEKGKFAWGNALLIIPDCITMTNIKFSIDTAKLVQCESDACHLCDGFKIACCG